jgi:hypothetical protein
MPHVRVLIIVHLLHRWRRAAGSAGGSHNLHAGDSNPARKQRDQ